MQLKGLESSPSKPGLEPEFCEWFIKDYFVFEKAMFCGIFSV
jgi:hypothetical protein